MNSTFERPACQKRVYLSIAILIAIWAVTQLSGIWSPPLLDDVDSIHTEAAREMVTRGDYVTLYCDGIRYLDKPPLPYWLAAGSMRLFGQYDWASRIPLALSVLALILYLYGFAKRLYGERAGFYSALVFATSIGPFLFTRFFIPDVMVALWMTISADLILRMVESVEKDGRAKLWQAVCFGLVITAAMLTKGLIGIVFPFGLLLLYLLLIKKPGHLWKMRPCSGALAWIVTALPWHWLAAVQNPASGQAKGWFWFYFINDQINRYLDKRIPRDYDKVPLFVFWALLVVWLLPWGVYLVGALWRWWKRRSESWSAPERLFLLWALLILGFFSFSTRQEYYTLPAVPALALLVGIFLAHEEEEGQHLFGRIASWILLGIGVSAATLCTVLACISRTPAPGTELYTVLTSNPSQYALSFGHFLDLTGESMGFFRVPLAGTAIGLFLGTGLLWWLRRRGKIFAGNLALGVAMCLVLVCAQQGLRVFYPILGSQAMAVQINSRLQSGDKIVIDGEYADGSTINFYTRQPIYMLNGWRNNLWYGSLFADVPHRFEDDASFLRLWNGEQRIFLVTPHKERVEELQRTGRFHLLSESSGRYLLSNNAD